MRFPGGSYASLNILLLAKRSLWVSTPQSLPPPPFIALPNHLVQTAVDKAHRKLRDDPNGAQTPVLILKTYLTKESHDRYDQGPALGFSNSKMTARLWRVYMAGSWLLQAGPTLACIPRSRRSYYYTLQRLVHASDIHKAHLVIQLVALVLF